MFQGLCRSLGSSPGEETVVVVAEECWEVEREREKCDLTELPTTESCLSHSTKVMERILSCVITFCCFLFLLFLFLQKKVHVRRASKLPHRASPLLWTSADPKYYSASALVDHYCWRDREERERGRHECAEF